MLRSKTVIFIFILVFALGLLGGPYKIPSAHANGSVWVKYSGNPLTSLGTVFGLPCVVFDGSTYKMWGQKESEIYYATSTDGVSWTTLVKVLSKGASGSWEADGVYPSTVIYNGTLYKMWYGGSSGGVGKIGYATSSDGVTWTKYSGNPTLVPGNNGGWDDWNLNYPNVHFDGLVYRMWYMAEANRDGTHRVGLATSSDGVSWTKYSNNPVLTPGSGWDSRFLDSGPVIKEENTYKMWYGARDGALWQIGLATSSDGVTWQKDSGNPVLRVGSSGSWDSGGIQGISVIRVGGIYKMWYAGSNGVTSWIGLAYSYLNPVSYSINLRTLDWSGSVLPSCNVTISGVGSGQSNSLGWANFTGVSNGTYLVTTRWQGNTVNQTSITISGSNVTTTSRSRVYDISFINSFKDASGNPLYANPSSFRLIAPNGTTTSSLSIGSYRLQNGTFTWKSIAWQGNNIAPSASFNPLNGSPTVNSRVYNLSIAFKNASGTWALTPNPSNITFTAPNGTSLTRSTFTYNQVQNGTYTITRIMWRGNNVRPSTSPTTTLSSSATWSVNTRVYSISFASSFKDSIGNTLYTPPSSFRLIAPNGTTTPTLTVRSYYLQNGTFRVSTIIWNNTDITPSPSPTFDPTNGNPIVNTKVFPHRNTPRPYDWPMFHHNLGHTGNTSSAAPNTNTTLWTYTTGGPIYISSPAVADGRVYIGSMDDKVYALNASTGALIWNYTTGGDVYSSPAVAYGRVWVGSTDGYLYVINATTGTLKWRYNIGYTLYSSPTVADGLVYVAAGYSVYALNATAATGILKWSSYLGNYIDYSSPAVAYGRVYVGTRYYVFSLNATTGAYKWSYYTGDYYTSYSTTAIYDGRLFIGGYYYVYSLNATTGAWKWSYYLGYTSTLSSPAIAYGKVYFSSGYYVYALNASDGSSKWSYYTGSYAYYSSPAAADGKVYVGAGSSLYALNATTGSKIWSYTTGSTVYSSPAIADGKVFVGSYDRKVYAFGTVMVGLNLRTVDWNGNVLPSTNVTVVEVGSKTSSVKGWANFTLQSGTYTVTARWQGSKVNQTTVTLTTSNVTMDLKSKVWTLTINAKDSAGNFLSPSSTQIHTTLPNGTSLNQTGVNTATYRVMNGTFRFAVKWQGNWVYGTTSVAIDVTTTTYNLSSRVYSLSLAFKDNSGASTINPSQISIEAPNGTLSTLGSYTIPKAQNGTWTLRRIVWQSNNVVPTPNPTTIATSSTTWTINARVYSISFLNSFRDSNGRWLRRVTSFKLTSPNGTMTQGLPWGSYRLQNGTYYMRDIFYFHLNVTPSTLPSFDPASGAPTVTCSIAQTLVGGYITTNSTWTAANSPYIVTSNIIVTSGYRLTLMPGTIVSFNGSYSIIVDGALAVQGNSTHPVRLTSNMGTPSPGDWEKIRFRDSSSDRESFVEYAIVEYSNNGIYAENAAPSRIFNSTIQRSRYYSLYVSGWTYQSMNISRNTFRWNIQSSYVVYLYGGLYGSFSDNLVTNNTCSGGYAVYIYYYYGSFTNNNITRNTGNGLYVSWSGSATFNYNTIDYNTGHGVYGYDSTTFRYNSIRYNSIGIYTSQFPFRYNNIYGNTQYEARVSGSQGVDASNNWWGTTNTTLVSQRVWDYYDDFILGVLSYTPILTSPVILAPETPRITINIRTIDNTGNILTPSTVDITNVGRKTTNANGWANFTGILAGTYITTVS